MSEAFSAALRAELDGLVARYEALAKTHQEALSVARSTELGELRKTIATLELEKSQALDAAKIATDRTSGLDAKITELDQTIVRNEQARTRERADHDKRVQELETQLRAAKTALSDAQAAVVDTQRKVGQLEAQVGAISDDVRSLEEAFTAERSFVTAYASIAATPLGEAVKTIVDSPLESSPATYAALKSRGLDALLVAVLKERARATAYPSLSEAERRALVAMAQAASCELIDVEVGARFSGASMERAATEPNPAEEGNVLECWIPGLRLAGTVGSMLFPRVLVATG